jgi:choline-glycine betaine transporter
MGKKLLDKLLLAVFALLVAAPGVGSILLGQAYHLPSSSNLAAWVGVVFIAGVGRDLRSKLSKPLFIPFFLGWCAVHTVGTIMVIKRFTILSVLPFTVIELFIGYAVAFRLFGLPPESKRRSHDQ